MPRIRLIDETTAGGRSEAPPLELEDDVFTVRDLISLRVRAEVRRYNVEKQERFYSLVTPTDLETMLKGPVGLRFQPIDAERQVDVALKAFRDQRFMLLLPTGQAEGLDTPIRLKDGDEVTFLRLLPLVGG